MAQGQTKVADVEHVSKGADSALEQILAAVDGVRLAAGQVQEAVERNRSAMDGVEVAVAEVASTSESHAASAEEVSAAAEEQSGRHPGDVRLQRRAPPRRPADARPGERVSHLKLYLTGA
jgi:methyl-accepting chemotaxis protein